MLARGQHGQFHEDHQEERIMRTHRYAVGQHVSHAANCSPKDQMEA